MNRLTPRVLLLLAAVVLAAGGCARQLMETPNLYVNGREDPFDEVPPRFQSNAVDVVYVGMLVSQELMVMAGLYGAYLVLAVLGFFKWRRSLGETREGKTA